MGRTLHEVLRIREVRDHRTGGTVVALDPSHAGADRDPKVDVLRLVRPLPGGRESSPSPRTLFLSRRFSIRTSASVSLSWRASALSSLTSSEVASRAVSP